jgi:hypothetical protein
VVQQVAALPAELASISDIDTRSAKTLVSGAVDALSRVGGGGWIVGRAVTGRACSECAGALTARFAGSSVPSSQGVVIAGFIGPSMQVWLTNSTWTSLGVGLAVLGLDAEHPEDEYSLRGYSGDVRLGHAFVTPVAQALSDRAAY